MDKFLTEDFRKLMTTLQNITEEDTDTVSADNEINSDSANTEEPIDSVLSDDPEPKEVINNLNFDGLEDAFGIDSSDAELLKNAVDELASDSPELSSDEASVLVKGFDHIAGDKHSDDSAIEQPVSEGEGSSYILAQVANALGSTIADKVSRTKGGMFIARRSYFYQGRDSAQEFANRVQSALDKAGLKCKIVDFGDQYKDFKGGAKIEKQSHFWVKFAPNGAASVSEELDAQRLEDLIKKAGISPNQPPHANGAPEKQNTEVSSLRTAIDAVKKFGSGTDKRELGL